jgi:nitric oxide reductase activation protein
MQNAANASGAGARDRRCEAVVGETADDFLGGLWGTLKQNKDEKRRKEEKAAAKAARKAAKAAARERRHREAQKRQKEAKPMYYTDEGLPVYSAESLNIGKGGGTPDCPFDCWCCF